MKTKILIILIILIGLGVGGFFVYQNISVPEFEKEEIPPVVKAPSIEVKVYKGIWLPSISVLNPSCLASIIPKLKDMGMNTVFLQGLAPQLFEKHVPLAKEHIIAHIQTAHRNGLKVALTIGYKPPYPELEEIDLEALNSKIVEYARLAEEYEVELFAPLNEPEAIFGPSASATWGQEILPKIREVYHGEVIWKGGGIGDIQPDPGRPQPTNFSGYDYLGFTISPDVGITLEEFSRFADYALDAVLGFAERDNVKEVMISEFYGESTRVRGRSEEEIARAHEIVLEKGKDKVAGFFVLEWGEPSCVPLAAKELELIFGQPIEVIMAHVKELELKHGKTKEVIKKWFTEIL